MDIPTSLFPEGTFSTPTTMSRLTRFLRSACFSDDASWEYRPLPLHQPGFPVVVCWSAKSGCTTVLKWFLAHNGLLDEALAYSPWIHEYRQQKFQVAGYRRQCERLFRTGHANRFIVKVIRDPATRAVSSFLHFLRAGDDNAQWPATSLVKQWKAAAGIERQSGLTFRQFLTWVTEQQFKRVVLDPHFRPQFDAQQDSHVDAYICLEDLAAGLRAVEDFVGLSHVDVHALSESPHHNPMTAGHAWPTVAADFPADRSTFDQRGTPPAEAFLDPHTLRLIRIVYGEDYDAYGAYYDATPGRLRMSAPSEGMSAEPFRQSRLRAA